MSGFNLTCVGDEDAYSYIETPYNNTISDDAIKAALIGKENVIPYTFLERGSDERQYCSPGIDQIYLYVHFADQDSVNIPNITPVQMILMQ